MYLENLFYGDINVITFAIHSVQVDVCMYIFYKLECVRSFSTPLSMCKQFQKVIIELHNVLVVLS